MDLTKIERMCSLIRSNATGRPDEFARRMGMSSRTMFNYISFMKSSLNAPIEYCNKMQSYYYKEKGLIKMKWTPEE
jgi:hypothetical protein